MQFNTPVREDNLNGNKVLLYQIWNSSVFNLAIKIGAIQLHNPRESTIFFDLDFCDIFLGPFHQPIHVLS